MPSPKRLPDADVLVEYAEHGKTNQEIGDMYGTSGEAVRQALAKAGYRRLNTRPTHARYLPWKIRGDHLGDVLARRLRAYSKRQQGKQLSATDNRLLDEWLKYMEGANPVGLPLSVHYDRNDDQGFWLQPRQPGDRDFISPPLGS